MKIQACEPCAKRKVRCDKEEPCSNCKRRKHDHCTYSEVTPVNRIQKLEALVRDLGGDPESETVPTSKPTETFVSQARPAKTQTPKAPSLDKEQKPSRFAEGKVEDPVVSEEDGQTFYLESRQWSGWLGHQGNETTDNVAKNPFLSGNHPHAFQGILAGKNLVDLATQYPPNPQLDFLWDTFYKRIFPLLKISFDWELEGLQSELTTSERRRLFSDGQHSYMFALCLLTIVSLSDEECKGNLQQPRISLLFEYQMLCEKALSRTNIFCMTDITVLKAFTMYMMAGHDRLSTQSLWSVMGLVIRNAEKLGIHRDGALLGLSPVKTEERRRLWWQLQHFDLALAIKSGLTPQTLMADWDVKLPLNIEDEDIGPSTTEPPPERKGLTSMSYCLFTYWVIDKQRQFFRGDNSRFEISWQLNQSIQQSTKDTLVDQLEAGLNKDFLQYCDPLKPLHILLQLVARMLVCGFRQNTLKPAANGEHRAEFLRTSIQVLEYNIAMHSQPSIKQFRWLTKSFLPWHAFMCLLVEAAHQAEGSKMQQIWTLLADLYESNEFLSELSEDRRRVHAAELVAAAWKARQNNIAPNVCPPKPAFVVHLETQLAEHRLHKAQSHGANVTPQASVGQADEAVNADTLFPGSQDANADFSLDFSDIDWAFWSSID